MRPGTYKDKDGRLVKVRRTATGLTITDVKTGAVTSVSDRKPR